MPIVATRQAEDSNNVLVATMDNAKVFYNLLRTVTFRETGVIFGYQHGLKVVLEDCKSVQGNVYLKKELFSFYRLNATDDNNKEMKIRLSLNYLQECLTLYTTKEANAKVPLKLLYKGYGHPLRVVMGEAQFSTECQIKTLDCDEEDLMDFDFQGNSIISKIIIKPSVLREVFMDMDPDCVYIFIAISPSGKPPDLFTREVIDIHRFPNVSKHFTIAHPPLDGEQGLTDTMDTTDVTRGEENEDQCGPSSGRGDRLTPKAKRKKQAGILRFAYKASSNLSSSYDFQETSDAIDEFQCAEAVRNKYEMELLKRMAKALAMAKRVSLRMDDRGVLSFQFLIELEDAQHCFVEFFCAPEVDSTIPGESPKKEAEEIS